MDEPRRTIGKYQLFERLGRGGMAEVYKGYHPNLNRRVAIKILHPHLADEVDFIGRFRREAQAVAQLRHPHIMQVYDFDAEGDQNYMVMEYIQGPSLKDLLDDCYSRGEMLPVEDVVYIFRALLDAVGYAHAHGMVHRDLKPANVMLEMKDEGGRMKDEGLSSSLIPHLSSLRPVLTDFGIAKIIGANKFTASGVTVGTPAYMSPEQGQGESGDERADIYALGVILYECLTGQVPYEGDTSVAVLLKHISAPIPSLSPIRPTLPVAYDRVIARAMAKDPEERFQSAHEMWKALETLTVDETAPTLTVKEVEPERAIAPEAERASQAATITSVEPKRPAVPLRRRWLAWGTILIALALAGVAVLPRFNAPSPAEQAITEGQQYLASGDAQLAADSFSLALDIDPDNVQALLGRAQAYEQLGQVLEALADLESAIAAAPEEARGYQERARLIVQYGLDDPAIALADFDKAIQLAPDSPRAHFLRGWAILNFALIDGRPNPGAALDDLNQAVILDSRNAETQLTLAQALVGVGDPGAALAPANRAVELEPENALHWKRRAHIQFALGDFNAARDDLQAAIEREADVNSQALLYAERAYLSLQLEAVPEAQADIAEAMSLAPASDVAGYVKLLLDPSLPRPSATQLEAAREAALDEPIWQAILTDLLRP